MKRPKVRVSVRGMMIVVAILALASLGGRELWAWWLLRDYQYPIGPSSISAQVVIKNDEVLVAGRPIPTSVTYDFKFGNPKPPPGTTCLVLGSIWYEDQATGLCVNGYTFDAPLTVGGRESASGTFTWDAIVPRPGHYLLQSKLYHVVSLRDLRSSGSQGRGYTVLEDTPTTRPSDDPGVKR